MAIILQVAFRVGLSLWVELEWSQPHLHHMEWISLGKEGSITRRVEVMCSRYA